MDTKEKIDLEKLLESMDTADTVTIGSPGAVGSGHGCGVISPYNDATITMSSVSDNWHSNTHSYSNIVSGGFSFPNTASVTSGPYTIGGAGTAGGYPWAPTQTSPKIKLDGEGADIEVNGWSLVDAIKKIEQRLNILTPNENLESEWSELRTLGDQYRKLEQHIKDKQATWDKLKAMPPPVID
jgi:hypothetical protein